MYRLCVAFGLLLAAAVYAPVAQGQTAQAETSVGAVLRSLTARAGVVFVGQVVRIDRTGGESGGQAGIVTVTFQVAEAVIGDVRGVYTLREWGGLWPAGQPRYQLGQRALLFLHSPNAAGLSSPVDGLDGVVPVVVITADAPALVDVRRLAARVQREPGTALGSAEAAAMLLPEVAAMIRETADTPTVTLLQPSLRPLPPGVAPRPVEPIRYMLSATARGRDVQ